VGAVNLPFAAFLVLTHAAVPTIGRLPMRRGPANEVMEPAMMGLLAVLLIAYAGCKKVASRDR
jgi:hypothetical protein